MLAAAAFDDRGEVLGGVGEMTPEVVTALPLPRTLLWAYLAKQADRLGCDEPLQLFHLAAADQRRRLRLLAGDDHR